MHKPKLPGFLIRSIFLLMAPTLLSDSPAAAAAAEGLSMTGLKTRIETTLLRESVAFYSEHLGMKVLDSWEDDGDVGAILGLGTSADGAAILELAYVETANNYIGLSLQFRVQDIDVVADELRGQLEFQGPVERPWGSKYIYLEDPTGVQVILYEGEL